MIKKGLRVILCGLCICSLLLSGPVLAANAEITSATVTASSSGFTVSGTAACDSVTVEVWDAGHILVTVQELAVSSGTFSGTISLATGAYTVKIADLEGGPYLTKTVVVTDNSNIEIGTPTTPAGPKGTTVTQRPNDDGTIQIDILVDGKPITKPLVKPVLVIVPVGVAGENSLAVIINADGTETPIIFSRVVDGKMQLLLSDSAKIAVRRITTSFADTASHWSMKETNFVVGRGLFIGTSPTTFSPEATVTLATLPQVLFRMAGEPKPGADDKHPGIEAGKWYSDAMNWFGGNIMSDALSEDITKRLPDDVVSTEILITMLHSYALKSGLVAAGEKFIVPDGKFGGDTVSDFATDAMAWAVGTGILIGNEHGIVVPGATVTRAVLVIIVARFISQQVVI